MDKTIEQAALEQIGTYDCKTCPPHYKVAAEFAQTENTRLCLLLADIRSALGDPEGKMMQEDFVQHCKEVVGERDRLRELEKVARKIYPKRMQCFGLDGADEANDLHRTIMRLSPYLSEQSYQDYLKREAALAGKE